jgi:hypothetical protein
MQVDAWVWPFRAAYMFTRLVLLVQNCSEGADSPANSAIDALAGINHMDHLTLPLDGMGRARVETGSAPLA